MSAWTRLYTHLVVWKSHSVAGPLNGWTWVRTRESSWALCVRKMVNSGMSFCDNFCFAFLSCPAWHGCKVSWRDGQAEFTLCVAYSKLDSLRWFSQRPSRTPHFSAGAGGAPPWAMTSKFELSGDFCTVHLPPSFIVLCLIIWKLSYWQTNKQTDSAEDIQRSSLRYDVG